MDERHLLVVRIGDEYFRDIDRARPFAEGIARWDVPDRALREHRLVKLDPRSSGVYRPHLAEPVDARWIAQRSPGDEIPGAGPVERLPAIMLRALGANGPAADAAIPVETRGVGRRLCR